MVGEYPSTTETFIEREIRGLRARGMRIEVVAVNRLSARHILRCGKRCAAVLSAVAELCRGRDQCGMLRAAGAALRAAAIAGNLRASHIHAHFLGLPATVAYCVSRMTGLPYSITAHAHDIYAETTPEIVVAGARFRTTCTRTGLYFLKNLYPGCEFELVRHGIDVLDAQHSCAGDGELRLLGVGRLVEKKGFEYLVEACSLLQKRKVPFRFTMVGEGPGEIALRRKIVELGLEGCVDFQPFCPHEQMAARYANSDVLVVPSVVAQNGDRDGVPNVILEAMAVGLPVVATGAGGIGEVVIDGLTGLLVRERDSGAIAQAVCRLHLDPDLRRQLPDAAKHYVAKEFAPEKWLNKLSRLFEESQGAKSS